jgi:hypothetical protein
VTNGTAAFDGLPDGIGRAVYVALTDRDKGRDRGRLITEAATVEIAEDGTVTTGQCQNRGPDSGPE